MSNNSTEKLNGTIDEKLDWLIAGVQAMGSRLVNVETKVESMDSRLVNVGTRVESMDSRLVNVETKVESMDSLLVNLDTKVESMDSRLVDLDTKVDKRLRETQPIWEGVHSQLAEVRETLQRHGELLQRQGEDMAGLRADTEKGFRTIDRRMERQLGEFERLHAYQRDLEDRIDRIEKLQTP
jgi:chromosome segregation ATPase